MTVLLARDDATSLLDGVSNTLVPPISGEGMLRAGGGSHCGRLSHLFPFRYHLPGRRQTKLDGMERSRGGSKAECLIVIFSVIEGYRDIYRTFFHAGLNKSFQIDKLRGNVVQSHGWTIPIAIIVAFDYFCLSDVVEYHRGLNFDHLNALPGCLAYGAGRPIADTSHLQRLTQCAPQSHPAG